LIEQASTIANRTELMALFSAGFNISLIAIGCLVGIVGILWSRAAKIHHLNTKVIDLECRTSDLNVPIVRLRPRKPVQGYMCLVAALSLSIAVYYVPDEVFFHEDYSKAFRYWTLLTGVFVIYSRGFFQPSINDLLENDRRSPILFLRSFGDEKWSLARNYQSQSGIFDFSLESRLASYFYNIGPFVAVSSPKIKYPYPGAIKAELDDDEWQDQIIAWMQSSQAIVLMIGTSHWLNWELGQVLTQGYSGKLILLFPEESGFLFFLRWRRTRNRFKNLCSIMSDTNWGPALQSIPKNQIRRIRSIILQENGNILVTTCSSKSREAYYIGAIVAHRTILNLENKNLADTGNGKYNEFAHREETQGSQSFGCIEE
jgi:hypothetical protein